MTVADKIRKIAADARQASFAMARLSSGAKNDLLMDMAMALINNTYHLIEENRKDLASGEKKGLSSAMLDRLMLDEGRIKAMADGLREVANLPDPVGEVTKMWKRPNGLMVGKMRIPLGVIGIIYEARPNVTVDAAVLALKSGITEVPSSRWDYSMFYEPRPGAKEKTYCKVGAFLDFNVSRNELGIPPHDFRTMTSSTKITMWLADRAINQRH